MKTFLGNMAIAIAVGAIVGSVIADEPAAELSVPVVQENVVVDDVPNGEDGLVVKESMQVIHQGEATESAGETGEMTISADRMEMRLGKIIELEGNVLVEDSEKNLSAEKMIVYLDEENRPLKIEALGTVTIRKLEDNSSATGDRGVYDSVKNLVILDGNCTVMAGGKIMNSQEIVFDLNTNTISVKRSTITLPARKGLGGGDGDLKRLFTPKADSNGPNGAGEPQ